MSFVAFTRAVPATISSCELTHLARTPIDVVLATAQHAAYETALRDAGCRVERIAATPQLPDSVFVEDAAVVLDEVAVITRPGAESRRTETASVADALRPWRRLAFIESPGTIDGGDVLRVGRRIFIGRSGRTTKDGVEQFRAIVEPLGYRVDSVQVDGVLHLKSAVSQVSVSTLLVNLDLIDIAAFEGFSLIEVDPAEPSAANGLLIGEVLLFPEAFPKTRRRLEAHGLRPRTLDVSELARAEGALTCCSLLLAE